VRVRRLIRGWTLARRASALIGIGLLGVVVALMLLSLVAGRNESALNELLNDAGPARRAGAELVTTLVEEQNAVRGYALTGDPSRRADYQLSVDRVDREVADLRDMPSTAEPTARDQLNRLSTDIAAWRAKGAGPLLAAVGAQGPRPAAEDAYLQEELRFGTVRDSGQRLLATLSARRDAVIARLQSSRRAELATLFGGGMLAALAAAATILLLRRWVTSPIERLAADARRVAAGDHEHRVGVPEGPPELRHVATDVERMRSMIVSELASVEASQAELRRTQRELRDQAMDLVRSNRDLEQFAYVASHDLQEPLRKVSGFCQLLQRRYAGQLDDRADQYIGFAVDGAQRMQRLINELLHFSRVGRSDRELTDVPLAKIADEVLAELEPAREQADGLIVVGALPVVHGDAVLLRQLLTNLVGNGLKFRRPEVPAEVRIDAEPDPAGWRIGVADNGIGIAPGFAEKIFVLFQRLHSKESYSGTGIGLALAKRIVEYHGGRIWLDTARQDGTTIWFTLPNSAHPGAEQSEQHEPPGGEQPGGTEDPRSEQARTDEEPHRDRDNRAGAAGVEGQLAAPGHQGAAGRG
jgi:signal transduction histidine kinase